MIDLFVRSCYFTGTGTTFATGLPLGRGNTTSEFVQLVGEASGCSTSSIETAAATLNVLPVDTLGRRILVTTAGRETLDLPPEGLLTTRLRPLPLKPGTRRRWPDQQYVRILKTATAIQFAVSRT